MYTAPCVVEGYLSQRNELYRINIATGNSTAVYTSTDSGTSDGINSLAYNALDNYLYATLRGVDPEIMLRVSVESPAKLQRLFTLPAGRKHYVGDITPDGYYWTAAQSVTDGWRWIKVDVDPSRPTYGQQVGSGTTPVPPSPFNTNNGGIQDWAYVPLAGSNLYAPWSDSDGTTYLYVFSLSTLSWASLGQFPTTTISSGKWNAVWASGDGYLYASEGNGGTIWKFSVQNGLSAQRVSTGPPSQLADGARCWGNTTAIGV